MVVLMRIDMIKNEPCRLKSFELRANLSPDLAAYGRSDHDREAVSGKVGAQTT